MNKDQISLVKKSWVKLEAELDRATTLLYNDLFELSPKLKDLFQNDFSKQRKMLSQALVEIVSDLDNPRISRFYLFELGQRHKSYGVKEEDYVVFGQALMSSIEKILGEYYDDAMKDAWEACYKWVSGNILCGY